MARTLSDEDVAAVAARLRKPVEMEANRSEYRFSEKLERRLHRLLYFCTGYEQEMKATREEMKNLNTSITELVRLVTENALLIEKRREWRMVLTDEEGADAARRWQTCPRLFFPAGVSLISPVDNLTG